MTVAFQSTGSPCLYPLTSESQPSLSCSSKVFVGLRYQSSGPLFVRKSTLAVEFHERVQQSLNSRYSNHVR
ncbi:hypothetical protein AMTR_s00041p00056970 [Amborella trichopoda]|uniref:Uncharacterized protein n=1 Tax=Amborella trichopoda TaxID=13333 RepID=W1PTF0_AMBTC|nr:hypothetical protein AMTR_s00041p00056970 [Amborella trichopoda]